MALINTNLKPFLNPRFDEHILVLTLRTHKQRGGSSIQECVVILVCKLEAPQPSRSRHDPVANSGRQFKRV